MKLDEWMKRTGAEQITSRSNPTVISYAGLSEKKKRDEAGLFLAEGVKLAAEALRYAPTERLLVAESALERQPLDELTEMAAQKNVPILLLSEGAFEKISTEKAPQGVIAVVRMMPELHRAEEFSRWQEDRRILMLDEIRDPGNLGTILRSAEALGAEGVILAGSVDLYSPKTVRAAMGTLFRLPVYLTKDGAECVRILRENGRRVLSAALGEHTLTLGRYETDPTDVVVIGNEGHGITPAVLAASTACVRIPMAGDTESLNASSAAACVLWEYFRA